MFAIPSTHLTHQQPTRRKQRRPKCSKNDDNGDDDNAATSPVKAFAAINTFSADKAAQYRVAGQDPEDDVPAYPFPHKAPKACTDEIRIVKEQQHDVDQELSEPNPALARRHLGVVNTILHRSLLQGNYARAARAWHLILTSGVDNEALNHTTMNLRVAGQWAIGAEILLRLGPSQAVNNQRAREYLARLAVQFPYQRRRNHQPIDFYVAYLGLWIRDVSSAYEADRERIESEWTSMGSDAEDGSTGMTTDTKHRRGMARREDMKSLNQRTLLSADEIASRLDDIRTSPPFDRNVELVRLRAMVSEWMADLIQPIEALSHNELKSDDNRENSEEDGQERAEDTQRRGEWKAELTRAQGYWRIHEQLVSGDASDNEE